MMDILFLFLVCFFSFHFHALAQPRSSNITLGSSLTPTGPRSAWLSPSGLYGFGFYPQASGYGVGVFLAGIPQKTVVWTFNRDDPPVPTNATLVLTTDGRLVLQSPQRQDAYIETSSSQKIYTASMHDGGNFVLFNSDHDVIWESFKHPTTTILQGQTLSAGMELFSSASETDQSTGIFRLKMQHDGYLVMYPVNTPDLDPYSYWSADQFDRFSVGDNAGLNLDNDGHLYVLNSTGFNVLNLTTGGYDTNGTLYLSKIDSDGILRLYSYQLDQNGTQSTKWSSTDDKCDPKGLCGLNRYCVNDDQDAKCICLPGFAPVMEQNFTATGCERNFSTESCKSNDVKYTIQAAENTEWEDISGYSDLSLRTREECETACLTDCNCDAAMFNGEKCSKQRLPLKYGRRKLSNSNVALIKVGISSISNEPRKHDEPKDGKGKSNMDILIVGISLIVFAILVLVISCALFHTSLGFRCKKISTDNSMRLCENVAPVSFTFGEIEEMTHNFEEEIGKGAFGTVYKGTITSDPLKIVAVKKLNNLSNQGEREFQNEMRIIGRTHHRNLVRLLGYCHDGANRMLIYEYMINGSLADVLFTPERRPRWNERVEIARNIARGLLYLHEECETQIIHCDIKSQNILMGANGQAKISDFGLSKLLMPDQTKTFTGIRGTRGYVAPEWHRKLPVTVKADVYSFGVVILEIVCCRRSVNWSLVDEEALLEEWVYKCYEDGQVGKIVAEDDEVDVKQLERMVTVGLWCILDEPTLRPSMKKVLLMLEGTVEIPIPPCPTSFFTAI